MSSSAVSRTSSARLLESAREVILRMGVAEKLYILVICLVYLMHNIWLARTVLWFVLVPVLLISMRPYRSLLPIVKSGVFVLSACFLVLILATSVLAGGASVALIWKNVRYVVAVLGFLTITAHLINKDGDFLRLLFLFVAPAAAIAAIVDVLWFSGFSLQTILTTRLEGVKGLTVYYNSNVIGIMFAIPCVGAVALMVSKRLARWQFAMLFASALVLLGAVVLTGSRGSVTAALAGIGLCVLLAANWRLSVAAVAVVILAAGIVAMTPLFGALLQRGDSLRLTLWPVYLHMAELKPWIGYGLAFDTQVTLPDGNVVMNAHNIILCALVRGGVFSAAALFGIVVFALLGGWRAWRRHGEVAPVALLGACLMASSVDYEIVPTDLGYLWILFWLPVAICLGASLPRSNRAFSEQGAAEPMVSDAAAARA
ncbi:MAG: O-antigen ligase family protein [Rhodopseudomonas sp.]|uniref:O-antigen ligase family protein n=1 Tax=Rhodopseudomonas sp. TaxID=1078 RepID=UPI0017E4BB10|nr:O-antigen ligase family protein [Rhodopseudomonas sp.]NVN88565.1 O-antigen ligase family protein [Rhodopseudomonas sp.]